MSSSWTYVALATLATACVEPSYDPGDASDARSEEGVLGELDAGARNIDASPDAGEPTDAGEPPVVVTTNPNPMTPNHVAPDAGGRWWSSLAEYYAVRIHFFGHDRTTGAAAWLRHEIVMLAHLTPNDDGDLDMELRRCLDHGYFASVLPIDDHWVWEHAQALAPEQHRLVMRQGKVQSEAPPRTLGYERDAPAACKPGGKLSFPERPWLPNGQCDCLPDALPGSANDCRVIDADGDMQPGITVDHSFAGPDYVRAKDDSQIREGVIDGARIHGFFVENYDYLGLSCFPGCPHNDILVCPLELNEVLFEPIPAQRNGNELPWDCASLMQAVDNGGVFPSKMLSFPTACTL